jgi:ring-1,2-phenylacetyl-CoA epoxidase subunit PaaD
MTTPEQDAVAAAARAADLVAARAGARPTIASIWQALARVPDPEIPVVSIVELGIVRDVAWQGERLRVTVTPTYSGCPATEMIVQAIGEALRDAGVTAHDVATALSPAWTTDWIAPEAKAKLRAYGIAPPGAAQRIDVAGISPLRRTREAVACPRCGSTRTALLAQFGSTACKALYRCGACREPFDYFKPH